MDLDRTYSYLGDEYGDGDEDVVGGGVGILFRGGGPGPDDARPQQAETFGGDFVADLEAFLARGSVPVVGGSWEDAAEEEEPTGGAGGSSGPSIASFVVGGGEPAASAVEEGDGPSASVVEGGGPSAASFVVGGDGPSAASFVVDRGAATGGGNFSPPTGGAESDPSGIEKFVVGGDERPPSEEEIPSVRVEPDEATGGTLEALLAHVGGAGVGE